jgi:hypothetical protein
MRTQPVKTRTGEGLPTVRRVVRVVTRRQLLLLATFSLATVQCFFWIFGALIGWSACCFLTPLWLAIAMTIGAVVNAVALIVFAMRRRAWGQLVLAAAQVGNIVFALVASLTVSPAWLLTDAAPALTTLILVVMLRKG